MAIITWNDVAAPNGGSFTADANWLGGKAPGASDDAVIPDLPGASPLITSNGLVTVKSVKTSESLTISGGVFSATTYSQEAGSFRMTGGTLGSTKLIKGTLTVASNSSFQNVTIDAGTTLNVSAATTLQLVNQSALTINGIVNLVSGTTLTLVQSTSSGNATQVVVASGGLLTATGSTINAIGNWTEKVFMTVGANARFRATDSTISVPVIFDDNPDFQPNDWSQNRINATLTIPHRLIPFLSAEAGSNNRRFSEIVIKPGTLSGGILNLRSMGTDSVADLSYTFGGDFTVAVGATLNIQPSVLARVANRFTLSVNGTVNLENGSTLTLVQTTSAGNDTNIAVGNQGNLILTSATINAFGNWSETTFIDIQAGGRMRTTDSLISVQAIYVAATANILARDWSNSRFDTNLYLPHKFIPYLSAADGGADNLRFRNIYIAADTLTAGVLELRAIGTENTANLNYIFSTAFTIANGATVHVHSNVRTIAETKTVVTVSGTLKFDSDSRLTLIQRSASTGTQLVIANQGKVSVTSATFAQSGTFTDLIAVEVQDGGQLQATDSMFAITKLQLANNAVLNPGDWSGNRFDTSIYLPHYYVDRLSAAGGGANNLRFADIYITSGTLTVGELNLRAIGTENKANLYYNFNGSFTVANGASLNVDPGVRVWTTTASIITIEGEAKFDVGSSLTLLQSRQTGTHSALNIGKFGKLTATAASFAQSGTYANQTSITVLNGGRLIASDSTFSVPWIDLTATSAFTSGDWIRNRFDTAIYIPYTVLPMLSAADGGKDNLRFDDIYIYGTTLNTGKLHLRAIGTENTANLDYTFYGNFNVANGATLNVYPGVRAWVDTSSILTLAGTANFDPGSSMTLYQTTGGSTTPAQMVLTGTGIMNANSMVFGRSGNFSDRTILDIRASARLNSTNSSFHPGSLLIASGANVTFAQESSTQSITTFNSAQVLANTSSIDLKLGSTLNLGKPLQVGASITDTASLKLSYSSTLAIAGSLTGKTRLPANFKPTGRVLFNSGIFTTPQLLEVMSEDRDAVSAGFDNNFAYGKIELAANTFVRLTNADNNWSDGRAEAIYVNTLIIPAGAKLDLNGRRLYVRAAQISGQLVDGASAAQPIFVPDGGPLLFGVPTPGTLAANQTDTWTFTAPQNAPVLIQLNPGSGGVTAAVPAVLRRVRVELLDNNNNLLKTVENTADGNIVVLDSAALTSGANYKIRVKAHSGFPASTGNYVITLLEANASETSLSIAAETGSLSQAEGNSGSITYKYTVTRFGDVSSAGTVNWSIAGVGLNPANASDFVGGALPSGTLTFSGTGDITKTITINVVSDTNAENDERFAITLFNPSNGMILTIPTVTSTIINDDTPDKPDLIVSEISVPTDAQTGGQVTLNWIEKNAGAVLFTGAWASHLRVVHRDSGAVVTNRDIIFPSTSLAPQATISRSFAIQLPDGLPAAGIYDVTITVDSLRNVTEANLNDTGESNNATSSSFTAQVASYPDLTVGSITAPSIVQLSIPFDVSWQVNNVGTGALTKAIRDRIYLSTNGQVDAGDRILATFDASGKLPVAAGGSYSNTISVTLPLDPTLIPGTYQILVVTDFANEQFELTETNNQATKAVSLELPPLPDLIVDSIQARALVVAGQSVDVTWVIKNQGTADATGTWNDRLWLSSDTTIGDDTFLKDFSVTTTILADGSIQRTQSVEIPAGLSGEYRFVVATDQNNRIEEYNHEDNNVAIDDAVIVIDSRASANLRIESVTALSSSLYTGQPATIEWVVANKGNASTNTSTWEDRVYLSKDSTLSDEDILLGKAANPSFLNVNDQYRNSLTASLPEDAEGTHYFIVVTDATNRVPETGGEDNNTRSTTNPSDISLTEPADLVVTTVNAAAEAQEGEAILVSWTVKNQGTGPTRVTSWKDQVYLSFGNSDIDAGDILIDTLTHEGSLAVAAQYQVNRRSIVLPENKVGDTAFIIVRTDSANVVYEHSFEGNNDTATESSIKISLRPRPDLRVDTITAPATATAGQPLSISYKVTNNSLTDTRQNTWQDSIYLSTDDTLSLDTDLLVGTRVRTGVLAGEQSETKSYNDLVLPNTLSGTYFVIVAADSTDRVPEFKEDNNIGASTASVQVVINPPDLVASGVAASASPKAGREFSVTYTVTNSGASPTPNRFWSDAIYLSTDQQIDSSDTLLGTRTRDGALAAGAGETRTVSLRLPGDQIGNFNILVRADNLDQVYELNNNNNVASAAIQIGDDRPDLSVSSFVPRLDSGEVLPGSTLAIDATVINSGSGATFGTQWFDRLVLSTDSIAGNNDDILIGSWPNRSQLAIGQSYSRLSENILIPANTPDGRYQLIFVTDARTDVAEGNEDNNQSVSASFTVTRTPSGTPTPDLQVSNITVPPTANSGQPLSISWTVRNVGTSTEANAFWYDSLWLSQDGTVDSSDVFIGGFMRGQALASNAQYTRTTNWPIGIDVSGTYNVIVITDSTHRVIEGTAESNNQRNSSAINISLGATADLQVSAITVPTNATSGRPMSLSWTVANAGGATASAPWVDRAFLSLDQIYDPATDIALGYVDRTLPLAASQNYVANAQLQIPAGLGGAYYVLVVTDSTNRVYERQLENNNTRVAATAVQIAHLPPADLVVGDITLPPTTQLNQQATITFTITNAGQNLAKGGWFDSIYLSADDTWDIDDGYFGRVQQTSDVAAGTSYTGRLTAPLPGVLPGNYKVIIRSDIRNYLIEENENNNLKATLNTFATSVPSLTLDVASSGTIAVGGSVYYKVDVPAGETLVIEIDAPTTTGAIELYSSFGTIPRRSVADQVALEPYQTKQRIVISETQAGTYYILAVAQNLAGATADYTIKARIVPFSVFDQTYGQGGTAGDRTIQINGAKFDRTVTVELVDSNNVAIPAVRYSRTSATRLYATFDLRNVERGTYSVRLTKGSTGETFPVPNSLQVVFATISPQPVSLTRPDSFNRLRDNREPAIIPVSLGWRNTTLNDIPVPFIHFSATDPFAASLADAKNGITVDSTEFLGLSRSDGPRDVLLPGEYGSAEFFVKPKAVSADSPPLDIHYVAEAFYKQADAAYVWDFDLSQLDLGYLSDDEAIAMLDAFRAIFESDVGAFRGAMLGALQRKGQGVPTELAAASRSLLQDVFDRFVAERQTSIVGMVNLADLSVHFEELVVTLSATNGQQYSARILSDGSFVFPKLEPGQYGVRVSGGSAKADDNLQLTLGNGQHLQPIINLQKAAATPADPVPNLQPTGLAPVLAPDVTRPGKINESLTGNVLEEVLPQLAGLDYRVELIGEAPRGFTLESDGRYTFLSDQTEAYVIHYDLVLPDVQTRVGRLLDGEIRSRGVLALTLKNNFTRDLRSRDPNDIIGPEGYGDLKWVSANERLPYMIRFENDPKQATGPAQVVRIVQTLDSDIDPTTVEFGSFGFRGKQFTVPPKRQSLNFDLDLRDEFGIFVRVFARVDPATSEISWTFSSILPDTGAETTRPEDGFLALNLLPPEGDGFVSYTVRANRSAATGTTLNARARIIFDGNAPIDTPEIFNTLDVGIPASSIVEQTTTTDSRLLVKWDGDDSDPGVGVATFDVYVSENGSRYRKWLSETDLLEAEYLATAGYEYKFVTIVRDHVGNSEADSKLPDASRPKADAGGPYDLVEGVGQLLSGSARDPGGSTTTFVYEWDFDYDGVTFDVDSPLQNPTLNVIDGPETRLVALRVRGTAADAVTSLISTATVHVTNAAPKVNASVNSVTGFVNTLLTASGTWSDSIGDNVLLTASLGQIDKNANGTWTWSLEPTSAVTNQTVTITATDDDGDASTTTFTLNASVNTETFSASINSAVAAITNESQSVVNIDFGRAVRGLSESDFTLVNATISSLTSEGNGRYKLVVRATDFGNISITLPAGSVIDDSGRSNTESATLNWQYADTANMDFGDAPASPFIGAADYPTRLANNGARHLVGGPRLGNAIDTENDGQPATQALGDDALPTDDEDGIAFNLAILTSTTQSTISSFTATVSAASKLDAWIDFNQDGDWNDVDEQVASSLSMTPGTQIIPFTVPAGAKTGMTYSRFRLSSQGGLSPTGLAADGEVEDHVLTLTATAGSLLVSPALGPHQVVIVDSQLVVRKSSTIYFKADVGAIAGIGLTEGTATVYSFVAPQNSLFGDLDYDGSGTVRITTERALIDLSALASQINGVDAIGLVGSGAQQLSFGATDINFLNPDHRLQVSLGVSDTLKNLSGWKWKQAQSVGGQLVQQFEVAEGVFLDVDLFNDWVNPFQPLDSNGSGTVTPLDALLVINQINRTSASGLALPRFNAAAPTDYFFADVNGDGQLSPLDALLVINYLNSNRSGEGEPAPLPSPIVDQALASADFWDLEDKRKRR